jgi:hypothetical protein
LFCCLLRSSLPRGPCTRTREEEEGESYRSGDLHPHISPLSAPGTPLPSLMGVPLRQDRTHTELIAKTTLPQGIFIPKNARRAGPMKAKRWVELALLPTHPASSTYPSWAEPKSVTRLTLLKRSEDRASSHSHKEARWGYPSSRLLPRGAGVISAAIGWVRRAQPSRPARSLRPSHCSSPSRGPLVGCADFFQGGGEWER